MDADLNVADSARMYFIYSPGMFSDLDLTQPDTVRFRFFAEIVWTLKLFSQRRFVLPIISYPRGVHRPSAFFRMFQIYCVNLSETLSAEINTGVALTKVDDYPNLAGPSAAGVSSRRL